MDNMKYRTNVMKTLSIGPAKAGLKLVVKKTVRLNVFHAAIGLATEAMELTAALSAYIAGSSRLTEKMKIHAFEEAGDISYYATVLAKMLKVKVTGSGKKVKLKGMTRTEAVLKLNDVAGQILDQAKKYLYGPVYEAVPGVREKKVFDLDGDGRRIPTGEKSAFNGQPVFKHKIESEPVVVNQANLEKTEAMFIEREAKMAALLEQFILVFWPFCYDTFEVPPSHVFVGNIAKLEKRYGQGFFELGEAEDRDTDAETTAMVESQQQAQATA